MSAKRICSRCKKRPAVVFITKIEGNTSTPEGLCIACAKELKIPPVVDMLSKLNLSDEELEAMSEEVNGLIEQMGDPTAEGEDGFEPGGAQTFPFLQNIFPGNKDEAAKNESDGEKDKKKGEKGKHKKKRKFLDAYCKDLTGSAKEGKLDDIIGREKELSRVIQILSRRQKNNPCLIGEPGVGKTAIAEGLALRITRGEVPARLMDKEIHLLDLTALVAGTQFRGQFESRIKGLIEEVKAEGNIILFIDEVHSLVGTGDAEGSMNAANIMKPALSRGEIQVIGATTFNEYRKYIEKDAALERRFQSVTVEEPSVGETIDILMGIKGYYESYHNVKVDERAVRRCVTLSERYINDRFLPDKAIDLLDEACACAVLRNKTADRLYVLKKAIEELKERTAELESDLENTDYEGIANLKSELAVKESESTKLEGEAQDNTVTDDDIAKVIELWTGIPAAKVRESDLKRLSSLEENIKKKIIGQDEAVGMLCAAVRRSRVQISPRRRPASFIFAGPTGVGKTELVKVLATELFNTPETLIRLDMSEFMEKHSVSRIIGSPPGYVGYDEAGQLTEKVRRKPYSVLLFDEIEKAHPDVMNILLQILDDGRITDAQGRSVNFENTVIVMTTNAGSERKEGAVGFNREYSQAAKEKTMKSLKEFLRPEFLSRVDEVISFSPLSDTTLDRIAELMLDELRESMNEKGIELSWDNEVSAEVAKAAHGKELGARGLRAELRRRVEDKIASALIEKCDDAVRAVGLTLKNGEIIATIS